MNDKMMTPYHSDAVVVPAESRAAPELSEVSEEEFERRLSMAKLHRERVRKLHQTLLTEGVDFGIIPGTSKPTLLKPGSEELCKFYRLIPRFETRVVHGDGKTAPEIEVQATCLLHYASLDGPVVGTGMAAGNSWEKKWRYRKGTDPEGRKIQVENPDPWEVENTIVKIVQKRSQVDATLRTTATSGLFSQDLEEMAPAAAAEEHFFNETPTAAKKEKPPIAKKTDPPKTERAKDFFDTSTPAPAPAPTPTATTTATTDGWKAMPPPEPPPARTPDDKITQDEFRQKWDSWPAKMRGQVFAYGQKMHHIHSYREITYAIMEDLEKWLKANTKPATESAL